MSTPDALGVGAGSHPRARRRPSRILAAAVAVVFLALGSLGVVAAMTIAPQQLNAGQPTVRGEIVKWNVHTRSGSGAGIRTPVLAFEANGHQYRESAALDMIASAPIQYPVGSSVEVHYQRDNPRFAWFLPSPLEMTSFVGEAMALMALGTAGAIAAVAVHLFRVRRWRLAGGTPPGDLSPSPAKP